MDLSALAFEHRTKHTNKCLDAMLSAVGEDDLLGSHKRSAAQGGSSASSPGWAASPAPDSGSNLFSVLMSGSKRVWGKGRSPGMSRTTSAPAAPQASVVDAHALLMANANRQFTAVRAFAAGAAKQGRRQRAGPALARAQSAASPGAAAAGNAAGVALGVAVDPSAVTMPGDGLTVGDEAPAPPPTGQRAPRKCPYHKVVPGTRIVVDGFRYARTSLSPFYVLTHFHSDHYDGLTSVRALTTHGPHDR